MPTYILCKKQNELKYFLKGHHFNNEKGFRLFFNEIDDIYSIETTSDIRLSLNFTYFVRQIVFI